MTVTNATTNADNLSRSTNDTFRVEVAGLPPNAVIERAVTIPEVAEPIVMGVRPSYEEYYRVEPGQFPPRATTTDVFVAAVASCMFGTFTRAVEARGLTIERGQLWADVESGFVHLGGGSRYVERIHLEIGTSLGAEHHDLLRKVLRVFEKGCWLSQTLAGSRCTVSAELLLDAAA
ncbi:OsmC family protein [Mycolicibacterium sp.]|uniref:OsmC family protein n=1 Tax=Mycolicibacterium sp. TaxID=2320850 RepID=UPI003D0F2DCC